MDKEKLLMNNRPTVINHRESMKLKCFIEVMLTKTCACCQNIADMVYNANFEVYEEKDFFNYQLVINDKHLYTEKFNKKDITDSEFKHVSQVASILLHRIYNDFKDEKHAQ